MNKNLTTASIKLTEFSHGAGCGCKISPKLLKEILGSNHESLTDSGLLVGNESSDDAAVYDLGDGRALISTTDFFPRISTISSNNNRKTISHWISYGNTLFIVPKLHAIIKNFFISLFINQLLLNQIF